MNDDNVTEIKRSIRRIINVAVAADKITPEESLAILMTIVATYVAQIDDDASRFAHVKTIEENFRALVEYSRGSFERVLAMTEVATETRQ